MNWIYLIDKVIIYRIKIKVKRVMNKLKLIKYLINSNNLKYQFKKILKKIKIYQKQIKTKKRVKSRVKIKIIKKLTQSYKYNNKTKKNKFKVINYKLLTII